MINPMDLTGKRILVTGATGGIGRETAILASRLGACLVITGRNQEKLQQTLLHLDGEGHLAVPFDLSDIGAIEAMIKDAVDKGGALDGCAQCAGMNKDIPINSVKVDKLHEIMLTNFYSFYELVRVISRKGRFNSGLSVVGVSSIVAECGSVSQTAYSASKSAMNGTMRSMAKELASKGIRVNTVLPGPTNTEMYQDYLALRSEVKSEEAKLVSLPRNYLGINEAVDVANAIVFLLSPASRMITGIELPVDGGYTSC